MYIDQNKHYYSYTLSITIITLLINPIKGNNIPALIVFGDSTVDTGNNNVIKTLLKSNFKPYGRDFEGGRSTGRFCNGRVPSDFISELFGLKKTVPAYLDSNYGIEDFATGVVFASAGTGYDNTTAFVLNVMPFWKEVELYKEYQGRLRAYAGGEKANEIIRDSVYLLSIGTNDFLENYYLLPTTRLHFTIQQFQDNLIQVARQFTETIYSLGARKIALTGLAPFGCLPLERTINLVTIEECNQEYNNVALEFNLKMDNLVKQLNRKLSGVNIVFSNPYYIFDHVVQNPSSYGIEVVNKACCGTGLFEMSYLCKIDSKLSCLDADKYLFWDSFHPTEKANQIVSQYLFHAYFYKLL